MSFTMNVLILGSGGREHALAWKIAQSPMLKKLFIAPGNAGTLQHGENVDLDAGNFSQIREFVLANDVSMLVVGPEGGLTDAEIDEAREFGFTIVHFGDRRLRAETAGILSLSLLLYESDEFN